MFKIYFLLFLLCFSNQYSQVTLSLNKDFDKNIADDICIQNDDWNKLLSRCEFYDTFCNELYKRFKINNVKYDRIDIFKSERLLPNKHDAENFKANFKSKRCRFSIGVGDSIPEKVFAAALLLPFLYSVFPLSSLIM